MTNRNPREDHESQHLNATMLCDLPEPLDSQSRLAILEDLNILNSPPERNFQMLTELANMLLETPVSLITLVTDSRQILDSFS